MVGFETKKSMLQHDNVDMSSRSLKVGQKNLLANNHYDWRSTNVDEHHDKRDFLVTSVKDTTPEKNRWARAKEWLSHRNEPDSKYLLKSKYSLPMDQDSKIAIIQPKVASPITINSPLAKKGDTYFANVKLQFGSDCDGSISTIPLKPWRREKKNNLNNEFQVQFDHIISSLDAKKASPGAIDKKLVEPTGDEILTLSPIRALFGRSIAKVSRNVADSANYLQQNEGAWVKVGTMSTHVASVRMQFNENFFNIMGTPQTSDIILEESRTHQVATISKSLSADSPIVIDLYESTQRKDTPTPHQNNECVKKDSKMEVDNSNDIGQLKLFFSDDSVQMDNIPAQEVPTEVNPYQLQLIPERPMFPSLRRGTDSQVFEIKESALMLPLRSAAMVLVLHSRLPHFEQTQRYIRFKEIYISRAAMSDYYLPSLLLFNKNDQVFSSALVSYDSSPPMISRSSSHLPEKPISLRGIQTINFTEHTTLFVILFSTSILIGYLAILVTRRLITMMNQWRDRRVGLYIARLEARAVESMVLGNFSKAIRLLEKGIKYILSRAGDQRLNDCAGFRHLLGKALASEGKFSAAEETFRKVKHFYEEAISDDLYLARILEDLGMVLQSQENRQDEAYELLSRALKMYEKEMMLTVIVLGSENEECDGASYHAQVYSARLMGDAIASADASFVAEVSCLPSQLPCYHLNALEVDDDNLRIECEKAVIELEAMLMPPTASEVQEIMMPHSATSIARRIDVARVRLEMGLVLEASGQLDDAVMIIEESYDIFVELSSDCDRVASLSKEKNVVSSFIEQVQMKLLDFENMFVCEEDERCTVETSFKASIEAGMISDMTYECDIVQNNPLFTPVKREHTGDSEKTDGGSPDTVMIF